MGPVNLHFFKVYNFLKSFIYLFLERGEGGRERERNISMCLPLVYPLLGTWPATRACDLTGNLNGDPLVCSLALNPLSHTSQGKICIFNHCPRWLRNASLEHRCFNQNPRIVLRTCSKSRYRVWINNSGGLHQVVVRPSRVLWAKILHADAPGLSKYRPPMVNDSFVFSFLIFVPFSLHAFSAG